MALIKCRECGNEISDRSSRCPKCGYPTIKTKKNLRKISTALLVAGFLITCITFIILKQEWDYRRTVNKYNETHQK